MLNLRPLPLGSIPDIKPVFVVGAGRSGTTPFQLALNQHPDLGVYGETQAFFVHRRFGAEPGEDRLQRLLKHWRGMIASCCPYPDLLDTEEMKRKLAYAPTYANVLDLVIGAIASREGKSRWGEKSPAHVFRLPEIRASFPNAQVIHIIRDPRAVVASNIKAFNQGRFSDWNIYRVSRYWLRCLKVHAGQQAEQERGRYMLVRYEDFVARPEETLQGVSSFLNMKFTPAMLEAHLVAAKYVQKNDAGDMPAHHALTQKPLDSSRTDAWKQVLSADQSRLVEQIVGKKMQTVGYEPSGRKQYTAPRMQSILFSTRWVAAEGRRIADKQSKTPLWALQRAIESRERPRSTAANSGNAPQEIQPLKPQPASAQPAPKVRRSGT